MRTSEGSAEPKTDAEQMTEIIAEATDFVEPEPVIEEAQAPKARAKRAASRTPSARKQKVVEPEVEATPSLDEVQVDVTYPVEGASAVAKVECPDCGKLMSQKTLRYSHGPNCAAKKQKQSSPREHVDPSVIEEVIENEVQKRLTNSQAQRAARRQEMVEKLI